MSLGPIPEADTILRLRLADWNCGNDVNFAGLPETKEQEKIETLLVKIKCYSIPDGTNKFSDI